MKRSIRMLDIFRRDKKLISAALAVSIVGIGFALYRIHGPGVFVDDVRVYRVPGTAGPTGQAGIDLRFARDAGKKILNVGIDLNGDGRIDEYGVSGGGRQQEWLVRDAHVEVVKGAMSFPFLIEDPEVALRNNFRFSASLTGRPVGVWNGAVSGPASLRMLLSSITPARP